MQDNKMNNMSYEPELQEYIYAGRTFRVLVVDDSKVIRAAIRDRLELGNLEVVEAGCGKQALESVYKCLPDLVLLDVVMPGMDGISVLKTLRATYSKQQLPIIPVTSRDSSSEIVQALDYGANDYITKPIDFDVMWARLSSQLMQKQAAEYIRTAQVSLEKQYRQRTKELNSSNKKLKQEIQERLLVEDRLQRQANYDELTGLPNRSLAIDRLGQTLVKAKRHDLQPCVAFLDLDNFKYVNDTLGHAAGDELLREASRRLVACSRESDTIARLGGDEFLLILDDDKDQVRPREMGLRHVGERVIESFARPFLLDGHEIHITPSLGFAMYPKDGEDGNKLMRHADAAMYRSKSEGKNTFCFYSPEMTVKAKMRMNVESQLQHALKRGEFSLNYQPIVDATSGKVIKAEVLLRWNCSELGTISPDYFVPIAEDTGLIIPIGELVIKEACKQVKHWRESGYPDISVTVNVSARQFQSDSMLVDVIQEALESNDLDASALQLEVTEGTLIRGTSKTEAVMETLEKMGVKLLIDDFGTGYASLAYLQRFNFDAIKIDRSYINSVLINDHDAKLVKAVVAMANSLGMSVISEGVETREQLEFIQKAGCPCAQGNLFSQPVVADEFDEAVQQLQAMFSKSRALELVSA